LARSGEPEAVVLVLDLESQALRFDHGSLVLRSYAVADVAAGSLRLGSDAARPALEPTVWIGGRLDPAPVRVRRVTRSDSAEPPDLAGAVDYIPPTPEEAVPAPPRYVIHFAGGEGLEVVAAEGTGEPVKRREAVRRAIARLRWKVPWNADRYRMRVVLPAADAGSLYRALPEVVTLVIAGAAPPATSEASGG
jgi:hypothetical protein